MCPWWGLSAPGKRGPGADHASPEEGNINASSSCHGAAAAGDHAHGPEGKQAQPRGLRNGGTEFRKSAGSMAHPGGRRTSRHIVEDEPKHLDAPKLPRLTPGSNHVEPPDRRRTAVNRRIADHEGYQPRLKGERHVHHRNPSEHVGGPPNPHKCPGLGHFEAAPRHQQRRPPPVHPQKPDNLVGPIPPKVRNEMVAAICGEKAITKGDLDRRPVGCGGGSCGGQRQRSGELHSFECAFL